VVADGGQQACAALPAGITEGRLARDAGPLAGGSPFLVLMGGGTEVDSAARTFVQRAGGGDVLVLRASGSVDSYTPYFFDDLNADPRPATVTTLRLDNAAASSHSALLCRVAGAEALWFAGGDQWDYAGRWDGALHQQVKGALSGVSAGGTSAGSMVLSELMFSAEHGSVTSASVLADPQAVAADVVVSPMAHPWLAGVIVDTHFSERSREGRLLGFAAHALSLRPGGIVAVGVDEDTALVIENGTWRVEGAGSVWVYAVTGPVVALRAGAPLGLQGIVREEWTSGSTGVWPALVTGTGQALEVVDGQVLER
jgi:cyanophycinase